MVFCGELYDTDIRLVAFKGEISFKKFMGKIFVQEIQKLSLKMKGGIFYLNFSTNSKAYLKVRYTCQSGA